jgi:hypothetical protein
MTLKDLLLGPREVREHGDRVKLSRKIAEKALYRVDFFCVLMMAIGTGTERRDDLRTFFFSNSPTHIARVSSSLALHLTDPEWG